MISLVYIAVFCTLVIHVRIVFEWATVSRIENRVYDRNTQNDTGYNTAMFHVRQPEGVVEGVYDHVSMVGYFQDNSDYV
jgi:hypothetical protein